MLLSQCMDRFAEGAIQGSDLTTALRAGGFDGVVIIQASSLIVGFGRAHSWTASEILYQSKAEA